MAMVSLHINGKTYTTDALPAQELVQGTYAGQVLGFCRQWMEGQEKFLLHTSGSTGTPKPITLTRRQLEASARMTCNYLNLGPADHALVCLNVGYIAGMMMLVRGLVSGMSLTIVQPHADPFAGTDAATKFSFAAMVPMQLQQAMQGHQCRLNAMRAVLVGGSPVSYGLEQQIKSLQPAVYATFGMTETVSHIALQRLNGPAPSGVFDVLDGMEIGQDDRGCLTVQGAVTNGQCLQTNDLVELQGPRQFIWLGRADHVINTGGVKVQLASVEKGVEKYFYQAGLGHRFVVVPQPNERLGQQVVLVVESVDHVPEKVQQAILNNTEGHFGLYEKPKKVYLLGKFPETPTGKPDRRAIQEWVASLVATEKD